MTFTLLAFGSKIVTNCFKVVWDTLQYFQGWQDSKNDYNHGLKNLKIYKISPQNAFIEFQKRDK